MPPPAPPVVRKPTPLKMDDVGPLRVAKDVYYRVTALNELWRGETYWFYFGLGGTTLTSSHREWARVVAKQLSSEPACCVEMYGRADTTGSNKRNFEVAGLRLSNFQAALRAAGAPPKKVFDPAHKNVGEEFAATFDPDEFPDPSERVVIVYVWTDEIARGLIYTDKEFLKFARKFKRKS